MLKQRSKFSSSHDRRRISATRGLGLTASEVKHVPTWELRALFTKNENRRYYCLLGAEGVLTRAGRAATHTLGPPEYVTLLAK